MYDDVIKSGDNVIFIVEVSKKLVFEKMHPIFTILLCNDVIKLHDDLIISRSHLELFGEFLRTCKNHWFSLFRLWDKLEEHMSPAFPSKIGRSNTRVTRVKSKMAKSLYSNMSGTTDMFVIRLIICLFLTSDLPVGTWILWG